MPCSAEVEVNVDKEGGALLLLLRLVPCVAEGLLVEGGRQQPDASWGSPLSINSGWRLRAGFTRPFISVWYVLAPCRPVRRKRNNISYCYIIEAQNNIVHTEKNRREAYLSLAQ